jgi:acetyl-CoA decarbonylase/synthase, CODH/ACS complex subunit delta
MPFTMPTERWTAAVQMTTIGATEADGGTRTSTVTLGGEETLPFLHWEGKTPNPPAIAIEVLDEAPTNWPDPLLKPYGDVLGDPAAWAQKAVEDFGADMICLRLVSATPDGTDASADDCAETIQSVLKSVGVPLIIWGCGDADKDNQIMPFCSQAAVGERCLLGTATEDNYKTICASALADKHLIINEAPLDINIQKQVNILVTDMGMKSSDIIMYQVTGAVGYGVEYAYSILERTRLAALGGDKMLQMPMLSIVGSEAWRVKEAWQSEDEAPEWGPLDNRGIIWEAATASLFLQAGTDILVMRHPEAVTHIRKLVAGLVAGSGDAQEA